VGDSFEYARALAFGGTWRASIQVGARGSVRLGQGLRVHQTASGGRGVPAATNIGPSIRFKLAQEGARIGCERFSAPKGFQATASWSGQNSTAPQRRRARETALGRFRHTVVLRGNGHVVQSRKCSGFVSRDLNLARRIRPSETLRRSGIRDGMVFPGQKVRCVTGDGPKAARRPESPCWRE